MKMAGIQAARRTAEDAVADMEGGPMQIAAFQTIFAHLLQRVFDAGDVGSSKKLGSKRHRDTTTGNDGTTARLLGLIDQGVFAQGRSLSEIRQALSERGWRYDPEDLGTPLTRLVRRGYLRRMQEADGGKRLWRYCNV
jgi:hypothetical protein